MVLLFLCSEVTAQVNCVPTYLKEYTGTGDMMPYAIRSLGDGTFIVAGKGMLNATSTYDGMVVKLAGDGTVLWSYYIGGPGQDVFTGITPLSDGGFLLYGTTTSFGYSNEKTWLVRIDNMGAMIWSRQLGNNTPGNDRIKAVQQFSDGDLIGTLNTDDSTAASNPFVFKMALDGTLVWARIFDHGNNDSFLSIAFDGNVIYAGGFYTVNAHRGVLVKMNSTDGSLISSINILKKDNSFNHEVVGLEVYNNIISYGLWMWRSAVVTSSNLNSIIMAQTDMNDRTRFAISSDFAGDTLLAYVKRTIDNGMLFIRPTYNYGGPPFVVKLSPYGANAEWGSIFTNSFASITSYGLDITADGGCVSAGFLKSFPNPYNRMSIMRMNANGITGNCLYRSNGLFTDTATYVQQPFTWAVQTAYTPAVNTFATPTEVAFNPTSNTLCNITLCTDVTPLPPACNKTYHLQYSSVRSTTLRDAVTTPDGGKLAIGDQLLDGLVMKINANGDIAWSKQYETFFSGAKFTRILKSADGNYFLFGNRYITLNHYSSTYVTMMKLDINGNMIWTRDLNFNSALQVGDVVEAPDGGFVLALNDGIGGGNTYSYVIRYDVNANPLWKREMKHSIYSPLYKSVYCTDSAVLLAYDSYTGTIMQTFGVDKLNLATGDKIWSKWYSAGSTEAIHINRIFAMNDTAYLFLTHSIPTGSFTVKTSPVLLTLKPDGSMIRNILFQGDNIAVSSLIIPIMMRFYLQ
jgi:hypothetical protein